MKRVYDNQSDIPAGLESYYTEKDDKWVRDDSKIEAVPAASGDITRLNTALKSEREAHKKTKETLTAKEAERVQAAEALEALQLQVDAGDGKPDENKIGELVTARVNAKVAPLNKKIDELTTALGAKDGEIVAFQTEQRRSKIASVVSAVAVKEKIVDTGIDDVIDLATRVMDINEAGQVVTKDGAGFTPGLDPMAFLGELKIKKPHLWPTSQGGGAKGSGGTGAQGDWGKMTLTERGQYMKTHGTEKANQLAKSSGYADATALRPNPK
jgi:hypothetical protein